MSFSSYFAGNNPPKKHHKKSKSRVKKNKKGYAKHTKDMIDANKIHLNDQLGGYPTKNIEDENVSPQKHQKNQSTFLAAPRPETHTDRLKKSTDGYSYSNKNKNKFKPSKIKFSPDDYNIFFIDAKVKEELCGRISTVPELYADLEKVMWILENGENPVDRVLAQHKAELLRKRICDLENTFELMYYIFVTEPILSKYRKLMRDISARPFVVQDSNLVKEQELQKTELMNQYLRLAQAYVEFEEYQQVATRLICEACNSTDFRLDIDEDSIYICNICNTEVHMMDDAPSFKDTDRVNMSSRYTYSRKGHFINAMKRFQGIQNTDPARIQFVVGIILELMRLHSLTRETVTKDHIYIFLSEHRNPPLARYYEDLNLIYHIITDKDCPDISSLENDLLDEFEKQEEAISQVLDEDRCNSLNVYYKLYKLLQRRDFKCCKDDFYILKTDIKQQEHDDTMKKAWKILEWDWIPTF